MSVVTSVILCCPCWSGEHIAARVNAYLDAHHHGQRLVQVDGHAGGSKAMQADVLMGAFNYMEAGKFADAVRAAIVAEDDGPPERYQLFLKLEDEDRFRDWLLP